VTCRLEPAALGRDEVGSHPASRGPFGVDHMSGNVFELTRSIFPTPAIANREVVEASFRNARTGLRVSADLPDE